MRLQYFGTAASDAIPTPFCNCEICRKSKQLGGRNIRTRSQALLNDDLLIDFNPDTVAHFLTYGVEWNQIDNCLITHSHADHLYVSDVIISRFSTNPHTVHYFSGKAGYELINRELDSSQIMRSENRADVTLVLPMIEFHAGGYDILPLPADHDPASSPLLYAIKREGKKILYAHDTGLFPEETVQRLKSFGKDIFFTLDARRRVEWVEREPSEVQAEKAKKHVIAADILKVRLAEGPVKATDVLEELKKEGISERTIHQTKKQLDIRSIKREGAWYWLLPESGKE